MVSRSSGDYYLRLSKAFSVGEVLEPAGHVMWTFALPKIFDERLTGLVECLANVIQSDGAGIPQRKAAIGAGGAHLPRSGGYGGHRAV